MWNPLQKIMNHGADGASGSMPPVVPLRKPTLLLSELAVGKTIHFSAHCPLKPFTGALAQVIAVRHYRFGDDSMKSFQLSIHGQQHYFLTVAKDDQGEYLGISRQLSELEQDSWFGRDALSFFTEASSAKSIRCKADLMVEDAWAAARYAKTVDWMHGSVSAHESQRMAQPIHYSLLVNEGGEKAFEIEHEDVTGDNRFFITVYRPISDIVDLGEAPTEKTLEVVPAQTMPATMPALTLSTPVIPANDDVPLFKEPVLTASPTSSPKPVEAPALPKQRRDFRRLDEHAEPIRIERTAAFAVGLDEVERELPSFLLAREGNYLSLDEVIPPEPERVRVGLSAAQNLIQQALSKNVRVRDVLRDMIGLKSALSEEVIFELPLTDDDYRTLAMRYKLRPDHRAEIRARLEEELHIKLAITSRQA
jgi:hypothetical protein